MSAPRPPLSKERVLEAAVALADEAGVEALSMRRLADRLGVKAMSLYNHVANKEEILDGIVESVVAEIELPAEEAEWKSALRENAISTREVLVRHPWAQGLWRSRQKGGPASFRRSDWTLRTLRRGGLSEELTYHAFHVLEAYVQGVTIQNLSLPDAGKDLRGLAASFLEQFPVAEYPDLAEHIRLHVEPPGGPSGFELGLDLILDGLERARDERRH